MMLAFYGMHTVQIPYTRYHCTFFQAQFLDHRAAMVCHRVPQRCDCFVARHSRGQVQLSEIEYAIAQADHAPAMLSRYAFFVTFLIRMNNQQQQVLPHVMQQIKPCAMLRCKIFLRGEEDYYISYLLLPLILINWYRTKAYAAFVADLPALRITASLTRAALPTRSRK